VQDGRFSALLDVDTVGAGDPRDDWATFLGHLAVKVDETSGEEGARYRDYARDVAAILDSMPGNRDEADARVAAVILGLASGGFAAMAPNWADLADARVHLAASWLRGEGRRALADPHGDKDRSEPEDENELIEVSAEVH